MGFVTFLNCANGTERAMRQICPVKMKIEISPEESQKFLEWISGMGNSLFLALEYGICWASALEKTVIKLFTKGSFRTWNFCAKLFTSAIRKISSPFSEWMNIA